MTLHPIILNRHGDAPAFVIEHNTKDAWRLRHQRTGRKP
jgi:hypothetical protein